MKIGGKVRIKTTEELNEVGVREMWVAPCQELRGHVVTVADVGANGRIKVNGLPMFFTPEEYVPVTDTFTRGDIVYVSDSSEEDAETEKHERTFLAYIEGAVYPYLCAYTEDFVSGSPFAVLSYQYAIKKEQKKKLSKAELVRFLEEHGVEVEE